MDKYLFVILYEKMFMVLHAQFNYYRYSRVPTNVVSMEKLKIIFCFSAHLFVSKTHDNRKHVQHVYIIYKCTRVRMFMYT